MTQEADASAFYTPVRSAASFRYIMQLYRNVIDPGASEIMKVRPLTAAGRKDSPDKLW